MIIFEELEVANHYVESRWWEGNIIFR